MPPAPGNQPSRVGCSSSARFDLPGLAAVVGAEEHAGVGAEVERLGLFRPAWRDVPPASTVRSDSSGRPIFCERRHVPPPSFERWTVEP